MKRIYSSLFFFFLMCNIPAFGQSASFLGLWPDAATLAMGGTGTVATTGAFSLYNNTAATVLSDTKGALGASYTLWQTGRTNHLAALSGFPCSAKKMPFLWDSAVTCTLSVSFPTGRKCYRHLQTPGIFR